jgi:hypothetical protein
MPLLKAYRIGNCRQCVTALEQRAGSSRSFICTPARRDHPAMRRDLAVEHPLMDVGPVLEQATVRGS